MRIRLNGNTVEFCTGNVTCQIDEAAPDWTKVQKIAYCACRYSDNAN